MDIQELAPMSPEDFKKELTARGWTAEKLAKRWGLSRRRVHQLIADADRGRYYDDGLRALPTLQKQCSVTK